MILNNNLKPDIVFYHFPCPDGFGAYVVLRTRLQGNIKFIPYDHSDSPPLEEVVDKNVLMIDCCFDPSKLEELASHSRKTVILDHHLGNKQSFDNAINSQNLQKLVQDDKLVCYFDTSKSGIRLAWEFTSLYSSSNEVPALVMYIEDRDLGLYKFRDETLDFCSYVDSLGYDYKEWRKLLNIFVYGSERSSTLKVIFEKGKAIKDYHYKMALDFAKNAFKIRLPKIYGGYEVLFVNAPKPFNTTTASILKDQAVFVVAFCYEVVNDIQMVRLSIRSRNFEVLSFAQKLGGNGHPNAAGAIITVGLFLELLGNPEKMENIGLHIDHNMIEKYLSKQEWDILKDKENITICTSKNISKRYGCKRQITLIKTKGVYADYDEVTVCSLQKIAEHEDRSVHQVIQDILKA